MMNNMHNTRKLKSQNILHAAEIQQQQQNIDFHNYCTWFCVTHIWCDVACCLFHSIEKIKML